MKTKDILFLVLVLAMIQDKALGAPKHLLIETKDTGAGFGWIAKYIVKYNWNFKDPTYAIYYQTQVSLSI